MLKYDLYQYMYLHWRNCYLAEENIAQRFTTPDLYLLLPTLHIIFFSMYFLSDRHRTTERKKIRNKFTRLKQDLFQTGPTNWKSTIIPSLLTPGNYLSLKK